MALGVYATADNLSFNPTMKFRIQSKVLANSAVALGNNHNINSPVCITSSTSGDCYWYFLEYKTGKYAIRNAQSGQYLVFDETRSDNPIRRYMHLDYNVNSDSALWQIGQHGDGSYYFTSVVAPSYCFNVRTNSYVLGTYNEGGSPSATNELFYLYKEDDTMYDSAVDTNSVCGIDKDGYYWTTEALERPVTYTTDDDNPILYDIINVRSGTHVNTAGTYAGSDDGFASALNMSSTIPEKQFYFKEAEGGAQIMVNNGKYVSAYLGTSTSTTPNDVKVEDGSPEENDHVWSITYVNLSTPGYAIGVSKCNLNSSDNPRLERKYYYWNDYMGQGTGICFYSIDNGSTFVFKSKDIRHRNYLAGLGLVIPCDSDTPVTPVDPVDPVEPTDSLELEPVAGEITHVYRADGKIDAIPNIYVDKITQSIDSILITTKDNGPVYRFANYEVDSVSTTVPKNFPKFNSFKFNNKYNPHLISDAIGEFYGDSLITLKAVCIGKRLRPSFKLDDDAEAFIGNQMQKSKVSRTRYDDDVVYTIARHGQTILRRTKNKLYVVYPYGQQTTVRVAYATDSATGEYKVPTIYITTNDGTMISSKTQYWDAKIKIDGAGVFPDMDETDMQIKGRGNSSWAGTWGKSPYHIKFAIGVKPLGLTKGKHWNLIANAQTYSMTSNAIAMKIAQLVETAGYNHEIPVELYINNEYRGSYNLTEKIGFANNSIDLQDETYATMLELDSYYDETYKFRTSKYSLPVNIKEPDLSEGTSPLSSLRISQSFNKVTTALYNNEDMSDYIDLDYLARFLFVNELVANTELMHPKSTYCYNENIMDTNSKYIFGPVWDFDWAYGYQYTGNYFTYSANTDFWTRTSMEATQWVKDMRYCGDNFDKIYYNLWHNFVNDGRLEELLEFCQDYYDYASESFTHDNTLWGKGDATAYASVTERGINWLRNRANYIYDYMTNTLGYADKNYIETTDGIIKGDVNGDGAVTTADLVCVLNYMLNLPNEDFNYKQADQDANEMITITDLIAIRDLIGTQQAGSGRFYGLPEAEATISSGIATHTATGVNIPLCLNVSGGRYSGLQFDLSIPKDMVIADLDISNSLPDFELCIAELSNKNYADQSIDHYRVSIYSSAQNIMPQGKSTLNLCLDWGTCDKTADIYTLSLSNVMFVNSTGEDERSAAHSTQFCPNELTGINSAVSVASQVNNQLTFNATEDAVIPIYCVDGRLYRLYQISQGTTTVSLPRGIYIINNKKIIVK